MPVDTTIMDIVIRMFQEDGGASDELTREQMEDSAHDSLPEFTIYFPRKVTETVDGVSGDITLTTAQRTALAAWDDAETWLRYVESPLDESDPDDGILDDSSWVLYPVDDDAPTTIKFIDDAPETGTANVRLGTFAMHTIDTTTTIGARRLRPFANLATAYCHAAAAAKYAGAIVEPLDGDSTNFPGLRDAHIAMADYRRDLFFKSTSPRSEDLEAAMETATAVPPPSHRGRYLADFMNPQKGTRSD